MGLTFNTILFNTQAEAMTFVSQINTCKGFPTQDDETLTWQESPYELCRFGENDSSLFLGYAITVKDEILSCMTQEQISEILTPEANVNLCSYVPPIPSGTTINQ
jgi:hypothetical protein